MAGQNGYDLIRKVRERSPADGATVPAVALSAYARAEDVERSLASGFAAHLAKPVELPQLLSAIAEATVAWSDARSGMGVQFDRLDPQAQTELDEFVDRSFFSNRKA